MVKSNLKLIDLSLKLLLDSQTLSLGTLLRLKTCLHGVHCPSMVLAGVLELLFLLSNLAINLLLDLSKLKLGSEDLVLLSLKGSLSLLKSGLELLLLNLKATSLFVKLMDGASTITKLVKEILDLISEVLVLTADNIKLLHNFIMRSLQSEDLRAVVSGLRSAGIKLSHQVISLALPLTNNLVKVVGSLLGDDSSSVSSLILHGNFLKLSLKTVLALLSGSNLGVQGVNGLLSLHDTA